MLLTWRAGATVQVLLFAQVDNHSLSGLVGYLHLVSLTASSEAQIKCTECAYVPGNHWCTMGDSCSSSLPFFWVRLNSFYLETLRPLIKAQSGLQLILSYVLSPFVIGGVLISYQVSSMLILGGSATVTGLTGMSTIAVSMALCRLKQALS